MARSESADARVVAVVVTYNRKDMLLDCLRSLAAQTHPVERVVLVDNASTDGTLEAVVEDGLPERLAVDYVRLERNGGSSEGYHYGVKHAREHDCDWVWCMDDDCELSPGALEALLAHPRASDPGTAALAPVVTDERGSYLPLNRGWLKRRWFLSPLVGVGPEHLSSSEVQIEHVSLVGPLVRTSVARQTDPPKRDLFIWWDDLEWSERLAKLGSLWLIPSATLLHKDPRPMADVSLRARWHDFRGGSTFAAGWKWAYGTRNMVFTGLRDGFLTRPRAASLVAVAAVRALFGDRHRLRAAALVVRFARDGARGVFRNVPPGAWSSLAQERDVEAFLAREGLSYDRDVDSEPRRLTAGDARVGR